MEDGFEQGSTEARQAVWDYCEHAAGMAEENPDNPYAVGLAKGYRDVQDKLAPGMHRDPTPQWQHDNEEGVRDE